MANYDFSTLNSSDLEELVCDLLNADQHNNSIIKYKTFKDGKDKGIDFLYSLPNNIFYHVGQVKHYYRSGYAAMISLLKKDELDKIKNLTPIPNSYIFATSVDLSVHNTEEIQLIFTPYIKNLHDIYGKKDLNRLLENNDHVLTNHYKLWFCDTSVLQKIINSDLEYRSSLMNDEEFRRKLRLYVKTPLFDKARILLKKRKYLIITGDPGVGKTTLAEMLAYEYIKDDYKISYIIDDIKEVERILLPGDSKQIIYYDDFLGSNAVEINKAKGSEAVLSKILRRIKQNQNKLLIFTTRSHLLISAIVESERLQQINLKDNVSKLEITEYGKEIKKNLLLNHIEESSLNDEFKNYLKSNKFINFIVNHKNFTPRIIEYITDKSIVGNQNIEEFKLFLKNNIETTSKIWEHAYNYQIEDDERIFLNTLLTFGESADLEELRIAFENRIAYEIKNNNKKRKQNLFNLTLKRLNEGFILIKGKSPQVHFINPSFTDFLMEYLRNDPIEISSIIDNITNTTQLTTRFFNLSTSVNNIMPEKLKIKILNEYQSFVNNTNEDSDLLKLSLVMYKYIEKEKSESTIIKILNEIYDWRSLNDDMSVNIYFREFLDKSKHNSNIYNILKDKFIEIINDLLKGIHDIDEAIDLLENYSRDYNLNYRFVDTNKIQERLEEILIEFIEDKIEFLKETIRSYGEEESEKREITEIINKIKRIGINIDDNILSAFDEYDWFEIAMDNEFRIQMEKDD